MVGVGAASVGVGFIGPDHAGVTVEGDAGAEVLYPTGDGEAGTRAPAARGILGVDVGAAGGGVGSSGPDHAGVTVEGDAAAEDTCPTGDGEAGTRAPAARGILGVDLGAAGVGVGISGRDHAGVTVEGDAGAEVTCPTGDGECGTRAPAARGILGVDVGAAGVGFGFIGPDHAGITVEGNAGAEVIYPTGDSEGGTRAPAARGIPGVDVGVAGTVSTEVRDPDHAGVTVEGDAGAEITCPTGDGECGARAPAARGIPGVDVGAAGEGVGFRGPDHAGVTVEGDSPAEVTCPTGDGEGGTHAPAARSILRVDVDAAGVGVGSRGRDHTGVTVEGDACAEITCPTGDGETV